MCVQMHTYLCTFVYAFSPKGNSTDQFLRYKFPITEFLTSKDGGDNTLTVVLDKSMDCGGRWMVLHSSPMGVTWHLLVRGMLVLKSNGGDVARLHERSILIVLSRSCA